jgi:hypothetical protein
LDKIGLRFTAWKVFHILAGLSSIGELQIQKEQINREAGGEGELLSPAACSSFRVSGEESNDSFKQQQSRTWVGDGAGVR